MEEMISVIVPIYNVEKYLARCVDSIINQTYRNLEIILVNDGSSDNSPMICDEYAEKDSRIIVVHKKNGGISSARNTGLEIAKGDLIGFVDPDDFIHERMYEILHRILIENSADIAVCGYTKFKSLETLAPLIDWKEEEFINTNIDALANLYKPYHVSGIFGVVPWNKLYRKNLFKGIRYPIGKIHEDNFLIHHILEKTHIVAYTTAILYYQYIRENSIMNEPYSYKRMINDIEAFKDRMDFFEIKGYQVLHIKATEQFLNILIVHYYNSKKYLKNDTHLFIQELFRSSYNNLDRNINKKLHKKYKLKYKVFYFSPLLSRPILFFEKIIQVLDFLSTNKISLVTYIKRKYKKA